MKNILLVKFIFLFGFVVYIAVFDLGLFSWKKYENSAVTFNFYYPKSWSICEETYSGLGQNFVHVSNEKIDCTNINFKKGSKYLTVAEDTNAESISSEADVKLYLEKMEFDSESQIGYKLPSTPGFHWSFQKYSNGLLKLAGSSTARVSGLTTDSIEYVSIYKNRVYNLKLSGDSLVKDLVIRIILWTFNSKISN
jgi:hypothetical protein